jgi:cysteinylglycine-S-conjugate dipeptidase
VRALPEEPAAAASADRVRQLMPGLRADLLRLARIPSIAFPGFPTDPLRQAFDAVAQLFHDAGVERLEMLSPADTAPIVTGGAIPLAGALHEAVPGAEILLFGPQDALCNLHAPNERVLLGELERAVVAEVEFLTEYAARKENRR